MAAVVVAFAAEVDAEDHERVHRIGGGLVEGVVHEEPVAVVVVFQVARLEERRSRGRAVERVVDRRRARGGEVLEPNHLVAHGERDHEAAVFVEREPIGLVVGLERVVRLQVRARDGALDRQAVDHALLLRKDAAVDQARAGRSATEAEHHAPPVGRELDVIEPDPDHALPVDEEREFRRQAGDRPVLEPDRRRAAARRDPPDHVLEAVRNVGFTGRTEHDPVRERAQSAEVREGPRVGALRPGTGRTALHEPDRAELGAVRVERTVRTDHAGRERVLLGRVFAGDRDRTHVVAVVAVVDADEGRPPSHRSERRRAGDEDFIPDHGRVFGVFGPTADDGEHFRVANIRAVTTSVASPASAAVPTSVATAGVGAAARRDRKNQNQS